MTTKQQSIAEEFGLPFWEVVKGFADDGETIHATAGILDYSHSAFRRLVERHGRADWFVTGQDGATAQDAREARRGRCTPALKAATQAASDSNPTYYRITWGGVTDTIAGHCRRIGLPYKTAINRNRVRPGCWDHVFSTRSHRKGPPKGKGWDSFRRTVNTPAAG